jgi:hypothetical protein
VTVIAADVGRSSLAEPATGLAVDSAALTSIAGSSAAAKADVVAVELPAVQVAACGAVSAIEHCLELALVAVAVALSHE